MKKGKKGQSGHGGSYGSDAVPSGVYAPYGGRWWNGEFYAYVEPDAGLTVGQVKKFERWLVDEAGRKGKWTGRGGR